MDLVKELFKSIYGLGTKKFWRWWMILTVFMAVVALYSEVIQTYIQVARDRSVGDALINTIFTLILWFVTVVVFVTVPAAVAIVYAFLDSKGIPNVARILRAMVGISRENDRRIGEESKEIHYVFGTELDGSLSLTRKEVQTQFPVLITIILFLLAMGISALELTMYIYIGWLIVLIYAVIFTIKRSKQG
ncbi:hypothetical protein GHU05_06665 [Fructobacillus tropaeoli]|uniref:hypothetical protein n=1 Tax=Fructobacillus tropaeoli TaxID=709323 RepID=UPI0014560D7E|nr:hypothetical protein [Fructobacillus tropaeoli]NLS38602.1 hypothetical protein [Fructobacillus tropaeoli]